MRSRRYLLAPVVVAISVSLALPAAEPATAAAGNDVCTIAGGIVTSGIGLLPTSNTFDYTGILFSCSGTIPGLIGTNTIDSTGRTVTENCAAAEMVSGSLSGTAAGGSAVSGTYSGSRVGTEMIVSGTITLTGSIFSGTYPLHAQLIFLPTNGICDAQGADPTTAVTVASGSTGAVG